jgi:hypothetical protein
VHKANLWGVPVFCLILCDAAWWAFGDYPGQFSTFFEEYRHFGSYPGWFCTFTAQGAFKIMEQETTKMAHIIIIIILYYII